MGFEHPTDISRIRPCHPLCHDASMTVKWLQLLHYSTARITTLHSTFIFTLRHKLCRHKYRRCFGECKSIISSYIYANHLDTFDIDNGYTSTRVFRLQKAIVTKSVNVCCQFQLNADVIFYDDIERGDICDMLVNLT